MEIKDIYYVAGILEGEGHFSITNYGTSPSIVLQMTDLDVVRRIRNLIRPGANIYTKNDNRELRYKDIHVLTVHGHQAVGWMMTIYPLMSERRQQKIKCLLTAWKANSLHHEKITGKRAETRRIYKNLARKHGISWAEVRHRLRAGVITSVN